MTRQRRDSGLSILEQPEPSTEPNIFLHEYPARIIAPTGSRADYEARMIELIRQVSGKADLDPKDVYPYRAVAASDGLDSYFTKHDVAGSLEPMASDFADGQSVLGNHDYRTFAYGRTLTGEVIPADVDRPEYEPTFYPKYAAQPELRTTKWLVTDAFIARGLELNGSKTDSIIRGMETGALGKISISFTVGQYRCGIDGHDMLVGWFGDPWPDAEEGCAHFPGVEYDEGVAYAVMSDTHALEESLVYKNASPSAMLLRKAEVMAARGLLVPRQIAKLEQRLGRTLPSFERRLFAGAAPEEEAMARKRSEPAAEAPASAVEEGEPQAGDPVENPDAVTEGEAEAAAAEGDAEPVAEAPEGTVVEETVETTETTTETTEITEEEPASAETLAGVISEAVTQLAAMSPEALAPSLGASLGTSERLIEDLLERLEYERSVGREVARQHEARQRLVTDILGELSVTSARALKERADIGDKLFEELVKETVAARVGVHGEQFDSAGYAAMLRNQRDVEFTKRELASWKEAKARRFATSRRQVQPRDPRPDPAPGQKSTLPEAPRVPAAHDDNVLAGEK